MKALLEERVYRYIRINYFKKVVKSVWRMPWLSETMKDVLSCDKLREVAQKL